MLTSRLLFTIAVSPRKEDRQRVVAVERHGQWYTVAFAAATVSVYLAETDDAEGLAWLKEREVKGTLLPSRPSV